LLEFCAGSREDRIGGSGPVICATAANGSRAQTAKLNKHNQKIAVFILIRRGRIGSQY
jgi:hypothetical protein